MKWMNWMNNCCIKTYSHSNSSISSSDKSLSSLVRSWIFSLEDPSFKSFSKSGFNICSNISFSPSNAKRCSPHAHVAMIEDPVELIKSTIHPFVGVNNSIRSWKKRSDFWCDPPPPSILMCPPLSSVLALISCTNIKPMRKETRFPCNALVRNQNLSKTPTHKQIMNQILYDNLIHVMEKIKRIVKIGCTCIIRVL